MKRVLAIINPISGTFSKGSIPSLLAQTYNAREEELFIAYTKGKNHARELAKEAVSKGVETIIAVGGDGTINEVASSIYGTSSKMGIIPKGSGNGLARALGIPIYNEKEAISIITQGDVSLIDTGEMNGIPFFCTCGVGFDADLTQRYEEDLSRGLLAYVRSAIKEYHLFKAKPYRIQVDGVSISREAFLLTCANIDQYGNNAYIAPHASLSDGLFDLVLIRPISGLNMARLAVQLFTKKIDKNACVDLFKGKHIIIEREEEGSVQIDGEKHHLGKELEILMSEKRLQVYAPKKK